MQRLAGRLLMALGLRAAPVAPFAPVAIVHRGEVEIVGGTAFLGAAVTPLAKLSPADAERLLGIPVRIVGR